MQHQEETQKTHEKHQSDNEKIVEKHQNKHQKLIKQVQELQKQLEDSKIKKMGESRRRIEEQLTQLSIAGSSVPATSTNPPTTQARQTWSQVASRKGPSPQHSARTKLLSDSDASQTLAQPLVNEGRTIETDISRARGKKSDLKKVKDKWIKAI